MTFITVMRWVASEGRSAPSAEIAARYGDAVAKIAIALAEGKLVAVGRRDQTPPAEIPSSHWHGARYDNCLTDRESRRPIISEFNNADEPRRHLWKARAMTAAGFTRSFNVADGFEGPPDEHGHRGVLAGWKAADLPWRQS